MTIEQIANRNCSELNKYGYEVYKKSEILNTQLEGLENLTQGKILMDLFLWKGKKDKLMKRQEIEIELDLLIKRLDKADEYFRNLDLIEVDNTKEWKALKNIIKRAAYLQGLLNEMEVQNAQNR